MCFKSNLALVMLRVFCQNSSFPPQSHGFWLTSIFLICLIGTHKLLHLCNVMIALNVYVLSKQTVLNDQFSLYRNKACLNVILVLLASFYLYTIHVTNDRHFN